MANSTGGRQQDRAKGQQGKESRRDVTPPLGVVVCMLVAQVLIMSFCLILFVIGQVALGTAAGMAAVALASKIVKMVAREVRKPRVKMVRAGCRVTPPSPCGQPLCLPSLYRSC